MTLTTRASLRIDATYTTVADLISGGLSAPAAVNETLNLADGTALGMADLVYFDSASLSGTTPLNLDLAPFTDIFGVSRTFVKVKLLYLKAAAANTQTVLVGNGTNPFIGPFGAAGASIINLEAGSRFYKDNPAGWAVTPTTGDILKLVGAGAGTHLVDIVIIGTSA